MRSIGVQEERVLLLCLQQQRVLLLRVQQERLRTQQERLHTQQERLHKQERLHTQQERLLLARVCNKSVSATRVCLQQERLLHKINYVLTEFCNYLINTEYTHAHTGAWLLGAPAAPRLPRPAMPRLPAPLLRPFRCLLMPARLLRGHIRSSRCWLTASAISPPVSVSLLTFLPYLWAFVLHSLIYGPPCSTPVSLWPRWRLYVAPSRVATRKSRLRLAKGPQTYASGSGFSRVSTKTRYSRASYLSASPISYVSICLVALVCIYLPRLYHIYLPRCSTFCICLLTLLPTTTASLVYCRILKTQCRWMSEKRSTCLRSAVHGLGLRPKPSKCLLSQDAFFMPPKSRRTLDACLYARRTV